MAANWPALKIEYVNGSMSLRELADKHGINSAGVLKRAHREGWDAERHRLSSAVSETAQAALNVTRPTELVEFNTNDIRLAKALKAMVAKALNEAQGDSPRKRLTAAELSSLATVAERAQKMGRLALGASTESTEHTGAAGGPIGITPVPVEVYLEARKKALDDY